jgi:hypothetical protein
MKADSVGDMLVRWGNSSGIMPVYGRTDWGISIPPQARVVTGNPHVDALIYYFEQESGVELVVARDDITDYRVVDQRRWVEFILRWS